MKNIFKLISFSLANASSGVLKLSHDLGFGKDTNLDAITKGRLFQVVIMTQNRLVRKNLEALISRNDFYQLVEEAKLNSKTQELEINSGGDVFSLGKVV